MEKGFKSLSLFEFQSQFPNDESCTKYLADLKWSIGFKCDKCGNDKFCVGNKAYDRQCTRCNHGESPTAGTLFHKSKLPILKAFYIIYYFATTKNGISSTEFSRKLALRQKTCWLFKQKVRKAMESSQHFPMEGKVDVDVTYVGGHDDKAIGRNEGKNGADVRKIMVVAVERKEKGVSRMYGRVIETADKKHLKKFMSDNIHKDALVRTDVWTGYKRLESEFPNLRREKSEKKVKNFPQLHRSIMIFKDCLRGTHHSVRHLQSYINEYTYRFNRHKMKEGIFQNLLKRMLSKPPCPYKLIISY